LSQEYIGSLCSGKEPLSADVSQKLLGYIPGLYKQWTYINSLNDLYKLYVDDGVKEDLPTYGETQFFQKILGVVTVAEYRDGVCGYCRDGNYLEKLVAQGKDLTPLEMSQYVLLRLHKVFSISVHFFFFLIYFILFFFFSRNRTRSVENL
jgi:hypothetical protein